MGQEPLLFCAILFRLAAALADPLRALSLAALPDVNRMNVSQEEYARMFEVYLRRVREKDYQSSYDTMQFFTFKHSGESEVSEHSVKHLHFPTNLTADVRVESATLRMLVDATTRDSDAELIIYQNLGEKGKTLVERKKLDASFLPRWTDVRLEKVSSGSEVRMEVECSNCRFTLSRPVLNLLVDGDPPRKKRENRYRTDCFPDNAKRQRCCRHKMQVVFKDLPGYNFILQPYDFDAGFCKGSCPYRYNPANHHASLQSLIWRQKKGAAPKPCCAPSKLDQLEILHLDEKDSSKLKVSTWSNMKVTECACF